MPAQIYVTKQQIEAMHDLGEDVIITEPPGKAEALDVWVMEEEHLWGEHHRSVIMDQEGTILNDSTMPD